MTDFRTAREAAFAALPTGAVITSGPIGRYWQVDVRVFGQTYTSTARSAAEALEAACAQAIEKAPEA